MLRRGCYPPKAGAIRQPLRQSSSSSRSTLAQLLSLAARLSPLVVLWWVVLGAASPGRPAVDPCHDPVQFSSVLRKRAAEALATRRARLGRLSTLRDAVRGAGGVGASRWRRRDGRDGPLARKAQPAAGGSSWRRAERRAPVRVPAPPAVEPREVIKAARGVGAVPPPAGSERRVPLTVARPLLTLVLCRIRIIDLFHNDLNHEHDPRR